NRLMAMPAWQRKPSARQLGNWLNVTNTERERLKLWTIRPCDMSDEQLAKQRKAKDRARKKQRRLKQGRTAQAMSLSRTKPWLAERVSRATWYRNRETTLSQPKDITLTDKLVSLPTKLQRRGAISGNVPDALSQCGEVVHLEKRGRRSRSERE